VTGDDTSAFTNLIDLAEVLVRAPFVVTIIALAVGTLMVLARYERR